MLVVGSPFTRRRSAFRPGAILPRSARQKRLALTEVADLRASTGDRPHRYTYRDSSWWIEMPNLTPFTMGAASVPLFFDHQMDCL